MSYDYLKDNNANPMFATMAGIVKESNCTRLLDIGCGYSRINEFLTDHNYTLHGIDSDPDVAAETTNKFANNDNITIEVGDVIEFIKTDPDVSYDCILFSGLLYYFKEGQFEWSAFELIDKVVSKYNPKKIIICEPRPSKAYITSDLTDILATWAYESFFLDLDIRMGNRVVYALETDRKRSILNRKIKADFNENSIHPHAKQPDFDDRFLLNNVYVTNTETIDDITKSNVNHYISVCAGYKSLYKACLDWEPGKQFRFTYIDVVPAAIDFRMYFDQMYPKFRSTVAVLNQYKEVINPDMMPMIGDDKSQDELDHVVRDQCKQLGITNSQWNDFITAYADAPKSYVRVDAVNNIKILNKFIAKYDTEKWFWYSNIHDWHQFRFTEETFYNWKKYLSQRNNMQFTGKVPPFTST